MPTGGGPGGKPPGLYEESFENRNKSGLWIPPTPCDIFFPMAPKQFVLLTIRKIKNRGSLTGAMKHNTRLQPQEHFDPAREHLNFYSAPLDEVMKLYEERLPARLRSNGIHVVECVVSGSESILLSVDYEAFFRDSISWLANRLGGPQNTLGYFIHRDEDVPHLHVLIMPLKDGKLCYSRFLGGSQFQLNQLQTDFAKEVAAAYGLERGIPNSGARKQSFHTYNDIVHAPIPEPPSMDIPKASFGLLTDPKAFGEEVLDRYRELLRPKWTILTQKARLVEFQDTEIQTLKKVNSQRAETIAELSRTVVALKSIILENGQQLEQYRKELEEQRRKKSPDRSRDKSEDRGRG